MNPFGKYPNRDRSGLPAATAGARMALIAAFSVLLSGFLSMPARTQENQGYWHEARTLTAEDLGVERVTGAAYDTTTGLFHLPGIGTVGVVNMAGDLVEAYRIAGPAFSQVAFASGRLYLLDPAGQALTSVLRPGSGDATAVTPTGRLDLAWLALGDIRGMAGGDDVLFILDASAREVIQVTPADAGLTVVGRTPLPGGQAAWRGLAYDPARSSLYTVDAGTGRIYELALDGTVLAVRDVTEPGLADVGGLVIAPSGDPTDDVAVQSLYVATGADDGGELTELALVRPLQPSVAPMSPAALSFRTVDTSLWSPPSPDPAGIDYSPRLRRLLIGDSEVEETSIFRGKNLFQSSTAGTLAASCDVTRYTEEPVGVAVNPANGTVYLGDDNADEVFEVRVGSDGRLCTADDIVRSFDTRVFNSFDPEGLAFGDGMVFVSDGEGAEVYAIHPGANGRFDGLPPTGDDRVQTSFDTASLGVRDPEGIGYHASRNSLFLVSRLERRVLTEVSLAGSVLNTFDIGPLDAVFPAGVGIGPSSSGAGQSIYIVDRGVDNDEDSNENDGRLYEVILGGDEPPPPAGPLYLSRAADGARAVGNLTQTADEDILYFDGQAWTFLFDGSDVLPANLDVDAFTFLDDHSLLLSFAQPGTIAGVGLIDDSDIVRFDASVFGANTAGSFSLYFDGSDVGLTANGEDIDALSRLADGRLVISTLGAFGVTGVAGRGEDLLAFSPGGLGANTSGTWALHFDGSDVGITSRMNVDGASLNGNRLYLTTANALSVGSLSAADEDVVICNSVVYGANSQCSFSPTPYFDGSAWQLASDDVDAIFVP